MKDDSCDAMWLPTQPRPDRAEGDAIWQKLVEAAAHNRKSREAWQRHEHRQAMDETLETRRLIREMREMK